MFLLDRMALELRGGCRRYDLRTENRMDSMTRANYELVRRDPYLRDRVRLPEPVFRLPSVPVLTTGCPVCGRLSGHSFTCRNRF
jgi:hypothetical protein